MVGVAFICCTCTLLQMQNPFGILKKVTSYQADVTNAHWIYKTGFWFVLVSKKSFLKLHPTDICLLLV